MMRGYGDGWPMRQIAAELIREKALRMLDDEIPHGIAVVVDQMKGVPNGLIVKRNHRVRA